MSRWEYPGTEEGWAARKAKEDAFWDRPDVLREMGIAEEDLPPSHRGGPYRRFRSPNVVDLVLLRKVGRMRPNSLPDKGK